MACAVCLFTWGAVALVGYYVLRYLWELIPVGGLSEKAVLISGCDTGFGRALSLKCARAGMTVFSGCFTDEGAKSLAKEAEGLPLHTVPLDVTKDASVAEARRIVDSKLGNKKLWAVVNNAGIFSCYGPADWCTPAEYELAFQVNTVGVVRCSGAFMDLLKASRGRLISVSSICGIVGTSGSAPYCVSKYGVEAFMDISRRELKQFGITCSLLEPGGCKATNLLDKTAMDKRVDSVWKKMSQKQRDEYGEEYKREFIKHWNAVIDKVGTEKIHYVVDNYYHAITAAYPRPRYQCGWDAILFWLPASLLPTAMQDYVMSALSGGKAPVPNALQHSKTE